MIKSCGLYALKMDGAFNAPIVALDDNQARAIVLGACDASVDRTAIADHELYRIGTLDFFEGIVDAEIVLVDRLGDFVKEDSADEISKTV